MNDILKDPDTIEKIKELISANLREDGWAEMAHIGALLSANNINLKANGYKVKAYNEPEEISLALVMTKTPAHRYRAVTIFTLDMAYSNARLITKPSSDWLIAETINMK